MQKQYLIQRESNLQYNLYQLLLSYVAIKQINNSVTIDSVIEQLADLLATEEDLDIQDVIDSVEREIDDLKEIEDLKDK
jgi:hypothetical protein